MRRDERPRRACGACSRRARRVPRGAIQIATVPSTTHHILDSTFQFSRFSSEGVKASVPRLSESLIRVPRCLSKTLALVRACGRPARAPAACTLTFLSFDRRRRLACGRDAAQEKTSAVIEAVRANAEPHVVF